MRSHQLDNLRSAPAPARAWPTWPLKTVLAVLFLGPIIAPLFQATGLPLIADSGWLARDILSTYICPTPAKSYMLAGHPMAVCARCWGATIGLWLAWFAVRWTMDGRWMIRNDLVHRLAFSIYRLMVLPWPLRLGFAALPFALWILEINFWPAAPLGVLLINGALAGFSAGLFVCSIWPGLFATHAPASLAQA